MSVKPPQLTNAVAVHDTDNAFNLQFDLPLDPTTAAHTMEGFGAQRNGPYSGPLSGRYRLYNDLGDPTWIIASAVPPFVNRLVRFEQPTGLINDGAVPPAHVTFDRDNAVDPLKANHGIALPSFSVDCPFSGLAPLPSRPPADELNGVVDYGLPSWLPRPAAWLPSWAQDMADLIDPPEGA